MEQSENQENKIDATIFMLDCEEMQVTSRTKWETVQHLSTRTIGGKVSEIQPPIAAISNSMARDQSCQDIFQ